MKGTQDMGSFSVCVWQPDKHETIYLNGGSDTRAASREYWKEFADNLGIPFERHDGWAVSIGGAPSTLFSEALL